MWTLGGFGTSRMLRLVSHLVLAWLLAPEIFGLMALVKVFMHGLEMFSDVGIGPSIIQSKRGDQQDFLNTAWTIQVVRGGGLWLATCLVAFPYAWLFSHNDEAAWQLVYLLPVAALSAVFAGFNSTALFTLNRELRIGRKTTLELGTQVVSLSVMVGWALVHPSVWAMIAGGLAAAFFKMVVSHFIVPGQHVRFGWNRECSRELFRFGKWIFLSTAFTFLALNLDKMVLGNVLTLAELGLYSIALVFAKVALDVTMRLGSTVMFPVYSRYQDNPKRLMELALRSREVVLWAGAAVCLAFAVAAPLFFETLWDERYHDAGAIARWVSVYIWARIMLHSMDRIPLALGNSRALFISNVVQTAGILAAIGGYMYAGLPGFIVGLSAGPVAAHCALLRSIPPGRSSLLMQSIRFTAVALTVGLLLVGLTSWLRERTDIWVWMVSVCLTASLPLLVTAGVVMRRIGIGRAVAREVGVPHQGAVVQ